MSQAMNEQALRAKSSALLKNRLRKVQKCALAAALVPLAVASASTAGDMSARVRATVTPEAGAYKYEFTIVNTSDPGASAAANTAIGPGRPWIVSWSIPLFDKADVSNVKVPEGWAFEIIEANGKSDIYNNEEGIFGQIAWAWKVGEDPALKSRRNGPDFYGNKPVLFEKPPYLLHFYSVTTKIEDKVLPAAPVGAMEVLKGFSFVSKYEQVNIPFVANTHRPIGEKSATLMGNAVAPNSPALQKAITTGATAIAQ